MSSTNKEKIVTATAENINYSNYDYIRSLTAEQLAKELSKNPPIPCRVCEYYNNKLSYCDADKDFTCVVEYAEALIFKWLNQFVVETLPKI